MKWIGPYVITTGSIQCITDRLSDEVMTIDNHSYTPNFIIYILVVSILSNYNILWQCLKFYKLNILNLIKACLYQWQCYIHLIGNGLTGIRGFETWDQLLDMCILINTVQVVNFATWKYLRFLLINNIRKYLSTQMLSPFFHVRGVKMYKLVKGFQLDILPF